MIPYIIIFILLLFPPKKININNWCFIILFIFTIIRWDVGWDYRLYYSLAESVELEKLPLIISNDKMQNFITSKMSFVYVKNELSLKIICKIIWWLKLPPETIFVFYGGIILFFIKKALENLNIYNKYVWIWFYCFPYFYFYSLSIIRQWAAISIFFYSYKYIKDKKFFKYFLIILFASCFHKTALLLLPIYFINKVKYNKIESLFLFIITFYFSKLFELLALNTNIPILKDYLLYIKAKIGTGGGKIFYLILVLYIMILIKSLLFKLTFEERMYFYGSFIFIALINFGHLSIRISIYFFVFSLIIVHKLTFKKNYGKICVSLLSLFLLISTFIADKTNGNREQYVPYQTVFNKKIIKK